MPTDPAMRLRAPANLRVGTLAAWLAAAVLAAGCASPPAPARPAPPPGRPVVIAPAIPAPLITVPGSPSPASAPSSVPAPAPAPAPSPAVANGSLLATPAAPMRSPASEAALFVALDHADRIRALAGAELAAEIARLTAAGPSPLRQVQLAVALLQSQQPAESARIQGLLQSVLAADSDDARSLRPLVRLLLSQHAHQRKLEEQAERQAVQIRDLQRRNEQMAERLEALRAIERSMPSRPAR